MLLTSFLSLGEFLSTLSLRRATCARCIWRMCGNISIHALLAESDTRQQRVVDRPQAFLSTLSLRRATPAVLPHPARGKYFYPRSPCGERLADALVIRRLPVISIHALLAESDQLGGQEQQQITAISIHALLAESDLAICTQGPGTR